MEDARSYLTALIARTCKLTPANVQRAIESASELVVFGSSACGLRTKTSDLDLLCIGTARFHFKHQKLDLLSLSASDVERPEWLCSEIANHILAYGVWLTDKSDWVGKVRLTEFATRAKLRRLESFATSFGVHWSHLGETFKQKYVTKLRRETHRLILLENNIPIPPTRVLDREWRVNEAVVNQICSVLFEMLYRQNKDSAREFQRRVEEQRNMISEQDLSFDHRVLDLPYYGIAESGGYRIPRSASNTE